MTANPTPVLLVPGLRDSGPAHWQSHWQRERPGTARFVHDGFDVPDLDRWSKALARAVDALPVPPLVVAHSFGCLAAVHAATTLGRRLAGALLVAPADPARFALGERLHAAALPFAATLVASSDDPWLRLLSAAGLASTWDANLVVYRNAGHINAESGFGPWSEGFVLASRLVQRAARRGVARHGPSPARACRRPGEPQHAECAA